MKKKKIVNLPRSEREEKYKAFLKANNKENLLEEFLNLRSLYLDIISELNNENSVNKELGLYSLRYIIEEIYVELTGEKLKDLKESSEELKNKMEKLRSLPHTEMEEDFEELYRKFFKYVYKYHVGYEEDFKVNKEDYHNHTNRDDFREMLDEAGMVIKVCDGY
jgi:hypothetical protein